MNTVISEKTISKEIDDKVNFMTFIITKFVRAYKMNCQQAYLYLKKSSMCKGFALIFCKKIFSFFLRASAPLREKKSASC
jgi:hypothetical protein